MLSRYQFFPQNLLPRRIQFKLMENISTAKRGIYLELFDGKRNDNFNQDGLQRHLILLPFWRKKNGEPEVEMGHIVDKYWLLLHAIKHLI